MCVRKNSGRVKENPERMSNAQLVATDVTHSIVTNSKVESSKKFEDFINSLLSFSCFRLEIPCD